MIRDDVDFFVGIVNFKIKLLLDVNVVVLFRVRIVFFVFYKSIELFCEVIDRNVYDNIVENLKDISL